MEIIHDKIPPMPEKSAFMFYQNFYPKPKIDLKDADISHETRQKLLDLQQKYNEIIRKHSSNIRLTLWKKWKLILTQIYPLLQVNVTPSP